MGSKDTEADPGWRNGLRLAVSPEKGWRHFGPEPVPHRVRSRQVPDDIDPGNSPIRAHDHRGPAISQMIIHSLRDLRIRGWRIAPQHFRHPVAADPRETDQPRDVVSRRRPQVAREHGPHLQEGLIGRMQTCEQQRARNLARLGELEAGLSAHLVRDQPVPGGRQGDSRDRGTE